MKKTVCFIAVLILTALLLAGCGCRHEHTEILNSKAETCTEAGYTGDVGCLDCRKIIEKGAVIAPLGHEEGELVGVCAPTCYDMGYTGDVYCTRCGELLISGEAVAMLEHTPGEREGVEEATCSNSGYTGDIRCLNCGSILEAGEYTEPLPHSLGEMENAAEATCQREGYTGDSVCTVCGVQICGETVPRLEHSFDGTGICTACGWMEPGLYLEDQLVLTWDELVSGGYITLDEDKIKDASDGLKGRLVIAEDVAKIERHSFYECNVQEVWFPCTMVIIDSECMIGSNVETVRMFGPVTTIDSNAFCNCKKLADIELPDTLQFIGYGAFTGCESLTKLSIPESVISIGDYCFHGCKGLQEIAFSEGLTSIGDNCFGESGLTGVVFPASLNKFGSNVLSWCGDLASVDLSACGITSLSEPFSNCEALSEVKLPAVLESANYMFYGCSGLKAVSLPEGLTSLNISWGSGIETIVWPESLLTAEGIKNCKDTLTTVHYRGSGIKWSLVGNKPDWMEGVAVDFDYTE